MKADFEHLERFRYQLKTFERTKAGDHFGCFIIPAGTALLRCVVDDGRDPACTGEECGWEHVSISVSDYKGTRIPLWSEMCWAKGLFWDDEECVVQYHPPKSDYVNQHPHCLHLFRHIEKQFPCPPSVLVGLRGPASIFR